MSYVLDALRRSERDRQIAMRQGASLLHAVPEERRRVSPGPAVRAGVALLAMAAVAGLWWWLRTSPVDLPPPAQKGGGMPPLVRESARTPERPPMADASPTAPSIAAAVPHPSASQASIPPGRGGEPASRRAVGDVRAEGVKADMPPIDIAGYISDEHGVMAMINDKLVREGEEVEPGLRLEKILDNGSLFNYRGVRFRR